MGLTGFGVFFLLFGMTLFFDKVLLAIGNVSWLPFKRLLQVTRYMSPSETTLFVSAQILFVTGLSFVIGLERTFRFFFQRHKFKATSFFLGGVFVVLIGWPIIGVVLEIYGFFLLFRSASVYFYLLFATDKSLCHLHPQCDSLVSPHWLSLKQRILPSGSGLHQKSACARVFAQFTRDQISKYFTVGKTAN